MSFFSPEFCQKLTPLFFVGLSKHSLSKMSNLGAPFPECLESKKPVIDCSAELREIIRCLTCSIHSNESDYKEWCTHIALRSVRDLIDILIEKTDNTNETVISSLAYISLKQTIEEIKTKKNVTDKQCSRCLVWNQDVKDVTFKDEPFQTQMCERCIELYDGLLHD